jgi:hypothetical protein
MHAHSCRQQSRRRMFKRATGDWTQYRGEGVKEVNFHFEEIDRQGPKLPHHELMAETYDCVLTELEKAQKCGDKFVMFIHGSSTSRRGKQTSRSEVRGFMRSKEATPYICRGDCIQHETVFVAAIRSSPPNAPPPAS